MDVRLLFGVGTLLVLLWMGIGGDVLALRRGWTQRLRGAGRWNARALPQQQAAAASLERREAEIAREARKATVRAFHDILRLFGGRLRFRKRLPAVMILGHMLRILDALYDDLERLYLEAEQRQPQGQMMREALRRFKVLGGAVRNHHGRHHGPGQTHDN